jgi:hypothetical protein
LKNFFGRFIKLFVSGGLSLSIYGFLIPSNLNRYLSLLIGLIIFIISNTLLEYLFNLFSKIKFNKNKREKILRIIFWSVISILIILYNLF